MIIQNVKLIFHLEITHCSSHVLNYTNEQNSFLAALKIAQKENIYIFL